MLFWIRKTIHITACFYVLIFGLLNTAPIYSAKLEQTGQTGFLVVAADRGTAGNEEIRKAFNAFSASHPAALVFVTDEHSRQILQSGLSRLNQHNIGRIVVLPLFISAAEPRYQLIHKLISEENQTIPVTFTKPYGESNFAIEALATRLRSIKRTAHQPLLVIGYGAQQDTDRRAMYSDWMRIIKQATQGIHFRSINSLILLEEKTEEAPEIRKDKTKRQLSGALASFDPANRNGKKQVVVFALGPKHDDTTSLETRLKQLLPANAKLNSFEPESGYLTKWMLQIANDHPPQATELSLNQCQSHTSTQ